MFSKVHEIEFAQVQSKVVEKLKEGNDCLTALHKVGRLPLKLGSFILVSLLCYQFRLNKTAGASSIYKFL